MNSKVYKWCAVPLCKNTSIRTPNKLFVYVPNKKIMRDKWLKLAGRDPTGVVRNSSIYFCEDHFDLPNDMENYMQYHVMGSVSQVRMNKGCIPKKFSCQLDRKTQTSDTIKRPYIRKKRKMMAIEENEKQLEESNMVTEHSNYEEVASGSSGIHLLVRYPHQKIENSEGNVKLSSGSEYMEHMTLKNYLPANKVGLVSLKYEEDIKKEMVTSCDAEMNVKTEIDEEKDEIDIDEHQLSYEQLQLIKTEEAVRKSDCSTEYYLLSQRLHPDHEQHINDMVTIKLETNEEKEDISDGTEIDMEKQRTEINDIKDEVEIKEHDLSYEQLKPVKSEDYEIEYDNEHMERRASKRCVSLNQLNYDCGQDVNDIETIKGKQYVKKADTSKNADLFQCFNCKYRTQMKNKLVKHCRMQHNRKTEWHQCHLCNFRTKYERSLRLHHTLKHDEIFHCELCGFKTNFKSSLLLHQRSKHNVGAELFHCDLCDYKTKNKSHLLNHHRSKHDDAAEIFYCVICDYKTKNKYNLVNHHRSKHDDAAEIFCCIMCDHKTKNKHNLSLHYKLRHDDAAEIFHCDLCDYKTKNNYYLSQHHKIKHDDAAEIFHCNRCDYKTKIKQSLLQHHRLKHDDAAKIFHCNLCDYKTKCKNNLMQHHTLKHDDSAEISHCELCDYKTKNKHTLLQHRRLKHDDEAEIFNCDLCDYETKSKHYLLQHHKSKHDDAAEVFCCKLCNHKTKRKHDLLKHYKSKHDDTAEIFHCDLCGFKSKYKRSLKHHRSKHNEKYLQCS